MAEPNTTYGLWRRTLQPGPLLTELEAISGDEQEIAERFYRLLEFGTGGMRGLLGAGTNRMNVYTIRLAAEGLARMMEEHGPSAKQRGAVIAYDTRHQSKEFAFATAGVLGAHGIRTYVFSEPRPTPQLSYAVRELNAFSGVVITASHNPKEYNGFKVYGEDGGQLPPAKADAVTAHMETIPDLFGIAAEDADGLQSAGLLTLLTEGSDETYQERLKQLRLGDFPRDEVKIVYTPIHGTGNVPVRQALENFGYTHVTVVPEQEQADPDFPTVAYPNPEEEEAFRLAIQLGAKEDADLLLATDPDADRLGVAVALPTSGYELLTGNQLGALLLNYILEQRKSAGTLPENGLLLKTIVTSEMGREIAALYGVTTEDTLTGFKYISEKIEEYTETGEFEFLFGYEESYGYLAADFVRDKDAVQAAVLAAEAAAYYKSRGSSLHAELQKLYSQVGYYREGLQSITVPGKEGAETIARLMDSLRENPPGQLAGLEVTSIEDYGTGVIRMADGMEKPTGLPRSNVLKFRLEDGSWCCARPSGTEPKCKFYIGVCAETGMEAVKKRDALEAVMKELASERSL
ncbi:phosphomannomutase [Sporosarcina sp. NCCP-2716]|uniref:phospho-sugar mutase n=1 Tax=Sporosarcina sp. NCCP-2716 TaxID=2943679 RepID=UPI00203AF1D9|nr:phospho-sugar mutase [Sporosarcina sp. NCCP-2716]GKV69317.1 phosphomannomutase [Sporosarcina sp. NCCP-2716]